MIKAYAIRDNYWYPVGDVDVNPKQGAPAGYTFTDPRTLNPNPDQWVRRGSSSFWELTDIAPAWDVDWYAARINEARATKASEVDNWYIQTYLAGGMPYNIDGQDVRIQALPHDVSNMQGMFLMAREQVDAGAAENTPWTFLTCLDAATASEYVDVTVSRAQILAIGEALFAHLGAAHAARRQHKKNLDQLTTIEDINSYVIG